MTNAEPEFVKVMVNIPDGDLGVFGEGMWAKPLGDDLYEVQNSPWHSREINYRDVVNAIPPSEDKNPVYVSVARRGGHRTIQIVLLPKGMPSRDAVLSRLNELGATYEGAHSTLFAVDFAPGIKWDAAKAYLDEKMREHWLEYRWSAY